MGAEERLDVDRTDTIQADRDRSACMRNLGWLLERGALDVFEPECSTPYHPGVNSEGERRSNRGRDREP